MNVNRAYNTNTQQRPRIAPQVAELWSKFDMILLGAVALLVLVGMLFIRSATLDAIDPILIGRLQSQIIYAFLGFGVLFVMTMIDYRLLGVLEPYIYGSLVFSLGLVAVAGQVGGAGAQRWLDVGIPIQPSEIGKMLIIIALGMHLTRRYHKLDRFSTVIVSILYMAIPMALIFIQPNLGNTIAFAVIWFVMIWGAGLRLRHLAILILVVFVSLPVLWVNMEEYQQRRITTFIDPDSDPDAQFNVDQSLISIGSGGLLGKGYASGSQTQGRFLRVRHTDFIFSVIAHETGFLGAATVLTLLGVVIWRITRAAAKARDPLGSLICYGVAGIIFFQTFTAVGMNVALLPVTGLTLPFVSSGGTSLLSLLFGIGLVQSVNLRRESVRLGSVYE
ncbi:MAG: FtsW/RodA/SpoVE family cell cycle protein [Anaerolineales bacterium]